jgi:hypothetical protein
VRQFPSSYPLPELPGAPYTRGALYRTKTSGVAQKNKKLSPPSKTTCQGCSLSATALSVAAIKYLLGTAYLFFRHVLG